MYRSTVVTAAATASGLTTLRNLKLDLDVTDTATDVYWQRQIAIASSLIQQYCSRVFARQTYRDDFHSSIGIGWAFRAPDVQAPAWPMAPAGAGFAIALQNVPVITIGQVLLDGAAIDPAQYSLDLTASGQSDSGFLYRLDGDLRRVPWDFTDCSVTYDAGYDLPSADVQANPLPPEIEHAAVMMVIANRQAGRLSFSTRDPYLRAETVEGVGSMQYAQTPIGGGGGPVGTIPQAVMQMLDPFVIPVVA